MASNLKDIIELIRKEGFIVQSSRPDKRRIYQIWRDMGTVTREYHFYGNEVRAWWQGYCAGLRAS